MRFPALAPGQQRCTSSQTTPGMLVPRAFRTPAVRRSKSCASWLRYRQLSDAACTCEQARATVARPQTSADQREMGVCARPVNARSWKRRRSGESGCGPSGRPNSGLDMRSHYGNRGRPLAGRKPPQESDHKLCNLCLKAANEGVRVQCNSLSTPHCETSMNPYDKSQRWEGTKTRGFVLLAV
jgi:hypothetical protein